MTYASLTEAGLVKKWLATPETHRKWIETYYGKEAMRFHELAINHIIDTIHPEGNALFLDAGCGDCVHSIQLATRGLSVRAVDISEPVLEMARTAVKARELDKRIRIEWGNLCELRFENESFDHILCWGVLIHIPTPELERAIVEISRVLRRGGALAICVNNMNSFSSLLARNLGPIIRRKRTRVRETPAGIEYSTLGPSGMSFVRDHSVRWLIRKFEEQGLIVQECISGEFSCLWAVISSHGIQTAIHKLNRFWFKYVKLPYLADSNIIIFRKQDTGIVALQ